MSDTLVAQLEVSMLTESDLTEGFNLWMGEYMNDPEAFFSTSEMAHDHLSERLEGEEYSYGETACATLLEYVKKAQQKKGE